MDGRFVAYYRVSTAKQGRSGLGLDAQRAAVAGFLNGGDWRLSGEFVEVESGKVSTRPQLAAALASCRLTGATLIVAKLDRLARDARFLLSVVEGTGKAGVRFCDLPTIPAGPVGKFLVTQMAAVAELEAGLISERTRAALAQAKARGTKLGGWRGGPVVDSAAGRAAATARADTFAAAVLPTIRELQQQGVTGLRGLARELSGRGVRTARGGTGWTAQGVANLLARCT